MYEALVVVKARALTIIATNKRVAIAVCYCSIDVFLSLLKGDVHVAI